MKISFILVNYQSQKYLKHCLDSLEKHLLPKLKKNTQIEVIIVNNDKKEIISLARYSFFTKVIESDHNIGFGAACNLGANNLSSDFLFFINPDTQLIDKSLVKMFTHIQSNPKIGIIGPKIISSHRNTPQPWTAGKKTSFFRIIFRNSIQAVWNKKKITFTDWISGTALLIRRDLFTHLQGFDEKFFMYFEDQDLCLRARKVGYQTCFFPLSKIIHHDGKSWNNKKNQKTEYYRSQNYFFKKYGKSWEKILLNLLRKISRK